MTAILKHDIINYKLNKEEIKMLNLNEVRFLMSEVAEGRFKSYADAKDFFINCKNQVRKMMQTETTEKKGVEHE